MSPLPCSPGSLHPGFLARLLGERRNRSGRQYCLLGLLGLFVTCWGCGSQPVPQPSSQEFTYPQQFDHDGNSWTLQAALTDADRHALEEYFQKNSSVAEGPLISGEPRLYTAAEGKKRYCWARKIRDTAEWLMLESSGNSLTLLEGTDAPFAPLP